MFTEEQTCEILEETAARNRALKAGVHSLAYKVWNIFLSPKLLGVIVGLHTQLEKARTASPLSSSPTVSTHWGLKKPQVGHDTSVSLQSGLHSSAYVVVMMYTQ